MSLRKIILFGAEVCFLTTVSSQTLPSRTKSLEITTRITPVPTHPPIPSANTPLLPHQFSDIPSNIINCWDSHANYSTVSRFLYTELLSSESYSWESWSTTEYSLSPYLNPYVECKTTPIPSASTLCDGYARASTFSTSCKTITETYTWTITGQAHYYTPPWSTELEQLPSPTCSVAKDYGPECSRLSEAYKWRQQYLQSQTPVPTGSIAGPGCSVLNKPVSGAKPTCYLEGGVWEAFHWARTNTTSSDFCANTTATPTTPVQPRTAVVSGLTLTSPSVYYFLRNATLQTFAGRASLVGDTTEQDVFSPSAKPTLLTVAQRESDILTISRLCAGSNSRRYCTFHASPGFSIEDLRTVRATEYCGKYGCDSSRTIYQEDYKPSLGLAMSDIAVQNSVFVDCSWTTPGARIRTAGPPAYNGGTMKAGDWHKITATNGDASQGPKTAVPGARL